MLGQDLHTLIGLGIESTAHTFAASIVDGQGKILSESRDVYHSPAGAGIHPREASRHHADVAPIVLKGCMETADLKMSDIDFISYSAGPGLGPCLRVGAVVARSLSSYYDKPLVPVNHAIGHLELGSLLTELKSPVCLLVSGGHTAIVMPSGGHWRIFGETLDITIGQLLDQFGRYLGLSSPCGPTVEKLALKGKHLPSLPYTVKGNDVSLSGILTACKNMVGRSSKEDLSYALQEHSYGMLCEVSERALAFVENKEFLVAGGVCANRRLMEMLDIVARRQGAVLRATPLKYAGDCGAQIAWTGLLHYQHGLIVKPDEGFVRQAWRLDGVNIPWRS